MTKGGYGRTIARLTLLVVLLSSCGTDQTVSSTVHGASWRFAVTDDSRAAGGRAACTNGVATAVMTAIAQDIATHDVDFVLFPGDMVGGETDDCTRLGSEFDTWKAAMAPVYGAGIPVYTTRGNHEYNPNLFSGALNPKDPSNVPYRERFGMPEDGPMGEEGLTYAFTWKNAQIIAFDSYAGRTAAYDNHAYAPGSNHGQAMSSWVIARVDQSTAAINFVMGHEMMFPSSSHPDCLANDPDSRDALVHALGTHNGTYFSGHDHLYLRGTATNDAGDSVPALVIGTAGGGNYDYVPFDDIAHGYTGPVRYRVQASISNRANPIFGYLLVTVNADNSWSGEFHGFQFDHWNDAADVSLTPITILDSFEIAVHLGANG